MKIYMFGIIFLLSIVLMSACGVSLDKEKEKAVANAEKAYSESPKDANENYDSIRFHLPEQFSIKDQAPNNIIMEKKAHPYILFYNQNEGEDSDKVYEITNTATGEVIVDQTFEVKDRFGYLIIIEIEENQYEVTAGIGGIKVTTESDLKHIAENAETLMKIANSGIIDKSASS